LPDAGDVSGNRSPRWDVYGATDGQLISTIKSLDPSPWPDPVVALIDPSGNRFYHLVIDRHASYPGPWPTQLVVNDMRTGTELDRLPLPNVVAGQNTGLPPACAKMPRPNGGSVYFPGAAISPDGQTLALVAPDAQSVTLVDLTHLSVRREISLTSPSTPTASPGAECYLNERLAVAVFAPDSNHLIVNQVDQAGSGANQTMTIRPPFRINLTTGRIDSTGPTDAKYFLLPQSTVVSPDGRAIYGFTFPNSSGGAIPDQKPRVTLVRIDTTTLHIEASREFTGFRSIVILPGG
jgi:hypothetical protein